MTKKKTRISNKEEIQVNWNPHYCIHSSPLGGYFLINWKRFVLLSPINANAGSYALRHLYPGLAQTTACFTDPKPSLTCDKTEECPATSSLNWDLSTWQESKALAQVVYLSILPSDLPARKEIALWFKVKAVSFPLLILPPTPPLLLFKSLSLFLHF